MLVMLMLMRSTSVFSVHRSEIGFTDYSTRRVLRVGLPAALQSNMFTIANIIIQSCINSFGTDTVAAWTAYGKVDGLFWMIMGALGISSPPLWDRTSAPRNTAGYAAVCGSVCSWALPLPDCAARCC